MNKERQNSQEQNEETLPLTEQLAWLIAHNWAGRQLAGHPLPFDTLDEYAEHYAMRDGRLTSPSEIEEIQGSALAILGGICGECGRDLIY